MSFGSRVRKLRLEYGMSQVECARRIGISPAWLNKIEHDKAGPPRAQVISSIINVLRLSQDDAANLREEAERQVRI